MRSVIAVGLLGIAACSGGEGASTTTEPTSTTTQAIIEGTVSPKEQDYVVEVVVAGTELAPSSLCTGTMVAKNLVLTARHCTGQLDELMDTIVGDYPPSSIGVYLGQHAKGRTAREQPDARGTRIFARPGNTMSPDISLLLLDTKLETLLGPIRLDGGAVKGELLDLVGYGLTEEGVRSEVRLERRGIPIDAVAPDQTPFGPLLRGEFQVGEGACRGDSGGPALDAGTGAVVGIASRVGNTKKKSASRGPADVCRGANATSIYTDLRPAQALIDEAFAAAEAEPWLEGEPSPDERAAASAKAEADRATADEKGGCGSAPSTRQREHTPGLGVTAGALVLVSAARRRAARRAHDGRAASS